MADDEELVRTKVDNPLQWIEISLRMLLLFTFFYLYGEWLLIYILKTFDLLGEVTLLTTRSLCAFFSIALTRLGLKYSNKKWRKHTSSVLITLICIYLVYFTWLKAWPSLVQS